VVENAFGILKQCFRELIQISDLYMTLLPDVIVCCCFLHNLFLGETLEEVSLLLKILQREGMVPEVDDDPEVEAAPLGPPPEDFQHGAAKRTALGMFLTQQRGIE
jgi:hypothetical protein